MSEYNHNSIEQKWQKFWAENKTYKATEDDTKEKFYALDMFPYPSGAGLHVGHPLGYIASDIMARYKKNRGFNVLHPSGYDSFGLPAEQYAIKTGQHPAITTAQNIARYRQQLDKIGFAFDWDREVRTSSPDYYQWTQWIFKQIFNSWYNNTSDKAEDISTLIATFEQEGNHNVDAACDETPIFTADEWNSWDEKKQQQTLMNYRLTYLADSWVNWCPELGTVLANDEIKDGVSERGGHPVEQKLMRQWSMRITAYAERLLTGLDQIDFSDALKEQQRNWIGKSKGASVFFNIDGFDDQIEVFTTRPDTIFGVTFMVLAPEHELVAKITTEEYKEKVEAYQKTAAAKSERDRQADVKNITGEFTGAYAIHPFTGEKVQIWIGDYVLATYGTGAVMAVPAGDQRDWDFANHFNIPIPNIFEGADISEGAYTEKSVKLVNSDFLNGLTAKKGIGTAIYEIEKRGLGKGQTNYRLREAIFSRQRYWGEPFPVYYKNDIPYVLEDNQLPVTLPEVDAYLPTEDGEPPLARAQKEAWNIFEGDRMEYNTMPGWAGSSWYFLRYMDPKNENEFVSKEKADYWNQVDLYIGGSEHATGHLLYSRFWTKFLYDKGFIGFDEPFKKLINQGMILGRSSFVYKVKDENKIVSKGLRKEYKTQKLHIDIKYVENDLLNIEAASKDPLFSFLKDAEFVLEDGKYICGHEIEKMSKSKYNVQTPDDLCEQYGADSLRCYEMFLGPLEQAKPWDTQGINGVNNFLKKLWRLFPQDNVFDEGEATKDALKTLHKTIKKVTEDIERYSFNTVISTFMIAVNELGAQKCKNKTILSELVVLISPFAPHITEELWERLGNNTSVTTAPWPEFNEQHIIESNFSYPVSFNGKMRFKLDLPIEMGKDDIEKALFAHEKTAGYLGGKDPKKIIIVPKRIINVVV
ncbi:MAG: leucine--tRNA ligase [Flavobacteriales bacterium]|jgi:leucyl-tRNA synthetase|nr:leucine--tRNA ligase [Flavobacteriales bacterium]